MGHKKTKTRIALLVDNPYRDLPGLALVAWRLCQKGATCYLVPMNLRNNEVWPLAPDFVLLNHFRTIYEELVKDMMASGILVGVLDTEGSVFSPVPTTANVTLNDSEQDKKEIMPAMHEYSLSMARDSNLRHNISCYLAWTPVFSEYASQAGWYRPEQVTVTGTPRMDFYAAQWHDAARRMSSYVNAYSEPMILINSSFTLANSRFQSPKKEAEMMINEFSYKRDFVEKWMHTQETALKGLSALANKIARFFPEVTVIYRPHPFEGEEIYKELLEPLPNLHLVKKGTVDGWLLRAKALIQWGSSTAIDASLASVPTFTARWLPIHLPVPSVEAVSIGCATEDELIGQIKAVLNGNFETPSEIAGNIEKVVEEAFYKIDGDAHKRVACAILDAIYSANSNISLDRCRDFSYGGGDKTFTGRMIRYIKKTFGLSPHFSFRHCRTIAKELEWDDSDKYFDANHVKNIVEAIHESAQSVSKEQFRKICVGSAREHIDYRLDYKRGRSVVLFPE
jgi:surface carbohydrate biosynthesis protein